MTIVEFLLARIAEDEELAHEAITGPWVPGTKRAGRPGQWRGIDAFSVIAARRDAFDDEWVADSPSRESVAYIARHDPTRVLAECAAKRRIADRYVDEHECVLSYRNPRWEDSMSDQDRIEQKLQEARNTVAEFAVRVLAAVYADHTDYDPSWRA